MELTYFTDEVNSVKWRSGTARLYLFGNLPAFPSFVGTDIYNVGTDMVVRELLLGILGVGEYLRHVLGTGIAERQHALRLLRLEILEFHQPVILVIVRTGDTGHLEIRTARRIVLLDGERIVAAQVTGTKLEEGATDEVLVDLVEYLRRELTEVLLEIIFHQRLQLPMIHERLISWHKPASIVTYAVQLVVIIHVNTMRCQIRQHHLELVFQRCHAQVI